MKQRFELFAFFLLSVLMVYPARAETCADVEITRQAISCIESKMASGASIPSNMVVFFRAGVCPPGWEPDDQVRGRYVVAVNAPGEVGAIVGEALADKENRATGQHSHPFVDRYNKHAASDGYLSGGGSSGSHPFDKTTGGVPGAKPGTNAPYVQLLACKKL